MNELHISQPPLAKFGINLLRLAWLALLFSILPVFFIVSGLVTFDQNLFWIFLFVVVPIGISIYRVILIIMNFSLEICIYEDGFTYSNAGESRKYLWREIDKIWTVKYELQSIIYIKYVKVKILDTLGNTLILDRTLQKVEEFEAILQSQVAADKFPRMLSLLEQGKSLEFEKIVITKDFIKNEHDAILWSELGNLQIWQGTIRLWKKGKREISIMGSISSIPNFALLMALIRHLSQVEQTTSPLQDPENSEAKQRLEKLKASESLRPNERSLIKPGGSLDARLTGLFILMLGIVAGYWQIFLPVKKALQQEPYISYSSEVVVIVSIAVFLGLFLLILGSEGLGILSQPSGLEIVLILIAILIFGIGSYLGMEYIMKMLGYY